MGTETRRCNLKDASDIAQRRDRSELYKRHCEGMVEVVMKVRMPGWRHPAAAAGKRPIQDRRARHKHVIGTRRGSKVDSKICPYEAFF